jgi:hypothetical protein
VHAGYFVVENQYKESLVGQKQVRRLITFCDIPRLHKYIPKQILSQIAAIR